MTSVLPLVGVLATVGCDRNGDGRFDGIDEGDTATAPLPTGADSAGPPVDTATGPNTVTTGGAEQCVILFGGNDRIRGPDEGLPVRDEPRTLQAWIRTRSRNEQVALGHGRPSPGQGLQLGTLNGQPMARAGSGNERVVGDVDVADDRWHHLAAVYDGNVVVLLVDGAVVATGALETWTLQGDVVAGNTPTGDLSKPWVGWLDDVRVFRTARRTDDLAADLDGSPTDENLVLWWDFEDGERSGSGVTVQDLSGHGHDGTTGGTEGSPAFVACR